MKKSEEKQAPFQLDYRAVFQVLPSAYLIIEPDAPRFTIMDYNAARAAATLTLRPVIGKALFDVFSDNPDNPKATGVINLKQSLLRVIERGEPDAMPLQRYDVFNSQTQQFEERYWLPTNIPVFDGKKLCCIVHVVEDVTDNVLLQKKEEHTQLQLGKLIQQQQAVLETIGDAFISLDQNWRVHYWNYRAEAIFGFDTQQIIGKPLWLFMDAEAAAQVRTRLQNVLKHQEPAHFECYLKDRQLWVRVNAYPSEQGLSLFVIDISATKKAQQMLEHSERKFRSLVENSADGIAIISAGGSIVELTSSARRILELDQNAVGTPLEQYADVRDREEIRNALAAVMNDVNHIHNLDWRINTTDGVKWMEGVFHFVSDDSQPGMIVLNFRDVSERKSQQQQLRDAEEKYRYLFENSPAAKLVWTLDTFTIIEVNQTALDRFGYSRDMLLGTSAAELLPLQEHERFLNQMVEVQRAQGPKNGGVWTFSNRSGTPMFMSVSFHRIDFAGLPAVMVLAIDVTEKMILEQRLNEEKLRRQQEITTAAITAQENERAALGKELHDNINQILNTARLYLEFVLYKKDDQRELIAQSHEYVGKAIEEIRTLSRTLLPPSFDISLKQSIDDMVRNMLSVAGVRLFFTFSVAHETDLANELGLTIFRIVQEQVNNIVKHARAREVYLSVEEEEGQILLTIKDNGVGFDVQEPHRGVGLRNIMSRVQLKKGQVDIHSKRGAGTVMVVRFPWAARQ